MRSGQLLVDPHGGAHDKLLFIHLHGPQRGAQRRGKIAPDQRLIGDLGHFPHGDLLRPDHVEALLQKRLAGLPAAIVPEKEMQGKQIPVFRIDAIPGKAATQSVGAVMHGFHALNDALAAHTPALPGDDGGDGAAGGNPHLTFQ